MPTLGELAALVGGAVQGPAGTIIEGVGTLADAGPRQIAFVTNQRHLPQLAASRAGAVMIAPGGDAGGRPALVVADPAAALPALLARFAPVAPPAGEIVDRMARVHPTARIGGDVRVGPYAVIEAEADVGAGTRIGALAVVGWAARLGTACTVAPLAVIGERCVLGDRVVVHSGAVLGADGFGFRPGPRGPEKIPQIGRVVVEDDVEIGANCTVDRATVGDTLLRRGVKLDDQVHVGHNCVIGEGTVVAGQTGFSGSVRVGRGCRIGGQVGIADHVTVGDGAEIGAQSGVTRDVPPGARVAGFPARDARTTFESHAHVARLPELKKRVRDLEARVKALEAGGGRG